jgi:flagellar biosynthesis GTPase FlhF
MAHPVPQLSHDESSAASLIDVDSPHVSSVKSDWEDQAIKTETQAQRIEREAEAKAERARQQAEKEAANAKQKISANAKKAKSSLKKEGKVLADNKDNPVVVGNAILWGIVTVAVGWGAYQKHQEGKLDWKLASTVAGGIGALAVGDYFASQCVLDKLCTFEIVANITQVAHREQVPAEISDQSVRASLYTAQAVPYCSCDGVGDYSQLSGCLKIFRQTAIWREGSPQFHTDRSTTEFRRPQDRCLTHC